jgi:hypothetical protein
VTILGSARIGEINVSFTYCRERFCFNKGFIKHDYRDSCFNKPIMAVPSIYLAPLDRGFPFDA